MPLNQELSMQEYINGVIPQNADIKFVLKEDFNGRNNESLVVVYTTTQNPYSYVNYVLYVEKTANGYEQHLIIAPEKDPDNEFAGFTPENAYAADINGDRKPELVLVYHSANAAMPYVVHWENGQPSLFFKAEGAYHGTIEVADVDKDGIFEILIEEEVYGEEQNIIATAGADPHITVCYLYKWNGHTYKRRPYPVQSKDKAAFNAAVSFLQNIWEENYQNAYNLIHIPAFTKLANLDTYESFCNYAAQNIRPALMKNLAAGTMQPGSFISTFNVEFVGVEYNFSINITREKECAKVLSIDIVHKGPREVAEKFYSLISEGRNKDAHYLCSVNYLGDELDTLIKHLMGNERASGYLNIDERHFEDNRVIIYAFYANHSSDVHLYIKPGRIMAMVLELVQNKWQINFAKYLGSTPPPTIIWEIGQYLTPEFADAIYPVYRLNFQQPQNITLQTYQADNPDNIVTQIDFTCTGLELMDILWGINLSFYGTENQSSNFVSTCVEKIHVCKFSEVAYFIKVFIR